MSEDTESQLIWELRLQHCSNTDIWHNETWPRIFLNFTNTFYIRWNRFRTRIYGCGYELVGKLGHITFVNFLSNANFTKLSSVGQLKVNKVKNYLPFQVYETATNQISRWYHEPLQRYVKKSQDLSLGLNFLAAKFFLVIDILLKWQQQIFICFCKFSRNFEEVVGSLRLLTE